MALQESVTRDGFGRLIKQVRITKSTAATHSLISAVVGKRIQVIRLVISTVNSVVVSMLSGTDDVMRLDLTTSVKFAKFVQQDGIPVMITNAGSALQVTLGGAVATYFYIQYVETD